jgi:DNA polymerase III subunit epsilon
MYAIVDIETTGGYATANGITEIAVIIHNGKEIINSYETLINPQQDIPPYITSLTGISNEMLKDAPIFDEVAAEIFALLANHIFVAHNVNFDFSFVNHQLKQRGFILPAKKLCTVRLTKKVVPGLPSYSLGNLCRSLNIPIQNRHRAGGDALATALLLDHLLNNGAQVHIDEMLKKSSSEQWLPLHLQKKDVAVLPTCPGVYYFHDAKGKIIYVGKAINIRKRVSSHFTINDAEKKRQLLLREVVKITYKQCACELEAIVLESTEIKRLWPKYNKSQKSPLQKYALYKFEDNGGYIRLAIDKKRKNLPALYFFNELHEGRNLLRKIISEFELNEQLCFLNKIDLKTENKKIIDSAAVHNPKVEKAIAALEEQLPTFAIVDKGINSRDRLCLLIERGCFWGMGYLPPEIPIESACELKNYLQPYPDNDTIRKSIYSFAELNPDKRIKVEH